MNEREQIGEVLRDVALATNRMQAGNIITAWAIVGVALTPRDDDSMEESIFWIDPPGQSIVTTQGLFHRGLRMVDRTEEAT